ncbi:MAG: CBS domain-containing protein [bacterium]|nr:CBS domain-containing protein [bacterium]
MKNIFREHTLLFIGIGLTTVLLAIFIILQYKEAEILKLETKWLFVAGVPLLVVLIVGGYIRSFKGFGIELEARLKNPISTLGLKAAEAATKVPGDEKGSREHLEMLTRTSRQQISRLSFIEGQKNYYNITVVRDYLIELRNVKYIEVRESNGEFICLIPVKRFKYQNEWSTDTIDQFIHAIENREVLTEFANHAITLTVDGDESILNVLKTMRKSRKTIAVVTSEEKHFMGVIEVRDIEKRIADEVISAKR